MSKAASAASKKRGRSGRVAADTTASLTATAAVNAEIPTAASTAAADITTTSVEGNGEGATVDTHTDTLDAVESESKSRRLNPADIAAPIAAPSAAAASAASAPSATSTAVTDEPAAAASSIKITVGHSIAPQLPAGMSRGYVAQFNWIQHYPGFKNSELFPSFTDAVASIPSIFQQIVVIMQQVIYHTTGRDILQELDKKVVKSLTPKEFDLVSQLDRKLVIRSILPGSTQDYMIHACRKEHVRLIFASSEEGGILGRLGLCPMLIELFSVVPGGKRTPVEKGRDYKCTCENPAAAAVAVAAVKEEEPAAIKQAVKLEPSPAPVAVVAPSTIAVDSDMHDVSPEPPQLHVHAPDSSTHQGLLASPPSSIIQRRVPGSGSGDAEPHGVVNCGGCNNWQKRFAKQSKIVEKLKAELQLVHEEKGVWEQKWNDEKDHNIRLWEKTILIQKQLRDMSRPLGVSLAHAMQHISQSPTQQIQAHGNSNGIIAAQAAMAQQQAAAAAQQVAAGVDPSLVGHFDPSQQLLSPLQLQQQLHPTELQSQYPINIQQQLAKARITQQQQQLRMQVQQQQQMVQ